MTVSHLRAVSPTPPSPSQSSLPLPPSRRSFSGTRRISSALSNEFIAVVTTTSTGSILLGSVEGMLSFQVFGILTGAVLVAAVVSLLLRFRRSRGAERAQLKWFVYAATLLGLTLTASILFPPFERSVVSGTLLGLALGWLPVFCGIAITRYRLYDIDRIINRTLVYGDLTVLLAAEYVGAVAGLGTLVGQSTLVVAASTLLVAALFRPARRRVQGLIDKRFYRRKYDAARALEAFTARLREEVDLDSLTADLVGVVRDTMQPAHASLWLRPQVAPR